MAYNTREEIIQAIKAKGRTYEEVDGFRIRSLTADERIALAALWRKGTKANKGEPTGNEDYQLLARTLVDETGQPIFDDKSIKEVIGELDGPTFQKVLGVSEILAGFRDNSVGKFLKNFAPLED